MDQSPLYQVLARLPLGLEEPLQGTGGTIFNREGGIIIGRPIVTRAGPASLPADLAGRVDADRWTYYHVVFPFDLEEATPGLRYIEARYQVRLDEAEAAALRLEVIPLADPRFTPRPGPASAVAPGEELAVFGLGRPDFRWRWRRTEHGALAEGSRMTRVLLQLPAHQTMHHGLILVSAVLADDDTEEPLEVHAPDPQPFRLDLVPPPRNTEARRAGPQNREPGRPLGTDDGTVRLCVATDLEGYSKRDPDEQKRMMGVLEGAVNAALAVALGGDEGCDRQLGGDGILIIMPPAIDERRTVRLFLTELAVALEAENMPVRPELAVRMRIGLEEGTVTRGATGFAGDSVVNAFRMCDSDVAKKELKTSAGYYVVITSDHLYEDVVRPAFAAVPSWRFSRVVASVPGKFTRPCWLHLPDRLAEGRLAQ